MGCLVGSRIDRFISTSYLLLLLLSGSFPGSGGSDGPTAYDKYKNKENVEEAAKRVKEDKQDCDRLNSDFATKKGKGNVTEREKLEYVDRSSRIDNCTAIHGDHGRSHSELVKPELFFMILARCFAALLVGGLVTHSTFP